MPDAALLQQLSVLLIPLMTYISVAGIRVLMPLIPSFMLPLFAGAIGPLLDLVLSYIGGIEAHGLASLALGLAAVGVHEVKAQVVKAFSPPAAGRLN